MQQKNFSQNSENSQRPDFGALIREAARMVTDTLEGAQSPAQAAITNALNSGASLGVMIDVIPKPRLRIVLTELEGMQRVLLEVELSAPPALNS